MEDEILIVPSGSPDSYCRLCFSETNVEALLVPGAATSEQPNQLLVDLIKRYVEIGLSPLTDAPCAICSTCRMMLEEFERFRGFCLRCDFVLTGVDRSLEKMKQEEVVGGEDSHIMFECAECPKKFKSRPGYEEHMRSHHSLPFRCSDCECGFSTQPFLDAHVTKYHTESVGDVDGPPSGNYECPHCPRIFVSEEHMKFHIQSLHESDDEKDDDAPAPRKKKKVSSNRASPAVVVGLEQEIVPPATAAPIVPMVSEPEQEFVNGVDDPNGTAASDRSKPFDCSHCSMRFHFRGSLKMHLVNVHGVRLKPSEWAKQLSAMQVDNHEADPNQPPVSNVIALEPPAAAIADEHVPVSSTDEAYNHPVPVQLYAHNLTPGAAATAGHSGSVPIKTEPQPQAQTFGDPCVVVLERLDPTVIPPSLNLEIPLGKYYHAKQKIHTAGSDPVDLGLDDEMLKLYPSFTRKAFNIFYCDQCDKQFDSKNKLRGHKSRHNKTPISVTCPICARQFSAKSSLDNHMAIHTNEFSYPCDECPLGFGRKDQLVKHKTKWHSPDSPQQELIYCPQCPRVFNKPNLFKTHQKFSHRTADVDQQEVSEELQVPVYEQAPAYQQASGDYLFEEQDDLHAALLSFI